MSRQTIVRAILRLYPPAWRREYGGELTDILLARRLSPKILVDVVWNGLWQRVRFAEPSTLLGLASVLMLLGGFVLTPGRYDHEKWIALLKPTYLAFPTVTVRMMVSEPYVLMLIVCGCWTQLRYGRTATQSGLAAMRMSLLAGIPIIVVGLLFAVGVFSVTFVDASARSFAPSPLSMTIAPIMRLPESWIWGAVGGQLGRWISRSRPRLRPAS